MNKETLLEGIDTEIDQLKKDLKEVKGEVCEVYTRIVGYYRAVHNWNPGKRQEYEERKPFNLEKGSKDAKSKTK